MPTLKVPQYQDDLESEKRLLLLLDNSTENTEQAFVMSFCLLLKIIRLRLLCGAWKEQAAEWRAACSVLQFGHVFQTFATFSSYVFSSN